MSVLSAKHGLHLATVLVCSAALAEPIPAFAQAARLMGAPVRQAELGPTSSAQTVAIDLSGPSVPVRTLALPRGKSATIDLPTDAQDVVVSDPKVADIVLSTRRRIYVLGVGSGQTDAAFMDAYGHQILRLNIRVDQDVTALGDTLNRLLPGSAIRVEPVNDSIVLSGEVKNAAMADKALRLAAAYVSKPEQVVNMLAVAQSEQVMLKVKVIEVSRTVIKQLGFNLSTVLGQLGSPQYLFGTAATWGVNGSLLGGLSGGYKLDTTSQPVTDPYGLTGTNSSSTSTGYTTQVLTDSTGKPVFNPVTGQVVTYQAPINSVTNTVGATSTSNSFTTTPSNSTNISRGNPAAGVATGRAGSSGVNSAKAMVNAFERAGLVKTLAEQTLTSVSGESANFLAGGEFPVPVAVDNTGRITAEYKPYGVGLGFTPVVLSSGMISIKMSTEVSELSSIGAFNLSGGGTSLSLPGLNVRRAQNVAELPSGGAMMIAGLLQSQTKETLDSLPGVMQLPVIGALLRSRDFQNNETELAIIVEAYLVRPVRPDQLQTPADGLQVASDVETNLLGRLNTGFGKTPAKDAAVKTYQGPYGYVVD